MLRAWPLLFFIVPLVEIYFLIQVGERIGAWMTVLLVIITAFIGVTLLREQGLKTLLRANQAMQAGQMPAQEMLEGFVLAAVGILLLTPGFFTDAVGFALLVPLLRKHFINMLLRHVVVSSVGYQSGYHSGHQSAQQSDYRAGAGFSSKTSDSASGHRTIDGECKRED